MRVQTYVVRENPWRKFRGKRREAKRTRIGRLRCVLNPRRVPTTAARRAALLSRKKVARGGGSGKAPKAFVFRPTKATVKVDKPAQEVARVASGLFEVPGVQKKSCGKN